MKKFAFRLDSALRWRTAQGQLERARLQALLADEARVQRDMQILTQERTGALGGLQGKAEVESSELRSLAAYIVGADWKKARLDEQLAKRKLLTEAQRRRVRDAELQVRLLEKLKEKKREEWQLEFDKDLENSAAEAWLAAHFGTGEAQ